MSTIIETMQQRLEQSLAPSQLEIIDESAAHIGHIGAQSGGHYKVIIASEKFIDQSLIECHRLVYSALGDLIGQGIHAVKIDIRS